MWKSLDRTFSIVNPGARFVTTMALALAAGGCGQLSLVESGGNNAQIGEAAASACSASGAPFGGGVGTASDPYRICSTAQFQAIGSGSLSAFYRLESDLDFAGVTFTPIASTAAPFNGALDGGSHEIRNLTILEDSVSDTTWTGIFRELGSGASIQDLRLRDVQVFGNNKTGVLSGNATGATIRNVEAAHILIQTRAMGGFVAGRVDAGVLVDTLVLDDISVSSSANGSLCGSSYDTGAGSVAGRSSGDSEFANLSITNANVQWSLSGVNISGWTHVGGIIGYSAGVYLHDGTFQGVVNGGNSSTGGIVGQFDGNGTGQGAVDRFRVKASVISNWRVGGIAGMWNRNLRSGTVTQAMTDVSFEGTVSGLNSYAGGIAGYAYFINWDRVSVKANVSANNYVGGIVGAGGISGTGLRDASFTGSVIGLASSSDYLGQLVGSLGSAPLFSNILLAGTISTPNGAPANTYADLGGSPGGGTSTGVFYRSSSVSGRSARVGTGLTDSQLETASSFPTYSVGTTWKMPLTSAYAGLKSPVLSRLCGLGGVICP